MDSMYTTRPVDEKKRKKKLHICLYVANKRYFRRCGKLSSKSFLGKIITTIILIIIIVILENQKKFLGGKVSDTSLKATHESIG